VGKWLGIDFGTKRIGLAVSDEMGWGADPLRVLVRTTLEEDLEAIVDLIETLQIKAVVVGVPFRLDGTAGDSAERARAFIDELATRLESTPVETRDEALTTYEAKARMKARGLSAAEQKEWVDAYAAAVILHEHLEAEGTAAPMFDAPSEPTGGPKRKGRKRRK
jgi:putative Holliday junction resolvase